MVALANDPGLAGPLTHMYSPRSNPSNPIDGNNEGDRPGTQMLEDAQSLERSQIVALAKTASKNVPPRSSADGILHESFRLIPTRSGLMNSDH